LKKEVKLVNFGVANNYFDCIEIHKDLPKFPRLYVPILKHEFGHEGLTTMGDLKHDLNKIPGLNYKEYYKFILTRPSTWVQYLPIWWHPKRGFVFDFQHIIIYTILILLVSVNVFFWMALWKGI